MIGIGIDVVPVSRIQEMLEKHGERMLQRFFTAAELEGAQDLAYQAYHLAGRVAAKEATYKALSAQGADLGISWQHMEVRKLEDGRPELVLYGAALQRFHALGARRAHLSLSHDGGIAAAVVVLE